MEISGYGSIFFAQETEESARARRGSRDDQDGSALSLTGGDTVSISEEARRLSEKLLLEKEEEQRRQEQEAQRQNSAALAGNSPAPQSAGQEGAAKAGGSGSGGSSSADQIQSIKEKIKQLEARLQTTASSPLPENVKQSQIGVLQSQINELQQQLNAMAQQDA